MCGPLRVSIEIPEALQLNDDIPFLGENVTQEARASVRRREGPACGRNDLFFREVAFDASFEA